MHFFRVHESNRFLRQILPELLELFTLLLKYYASRKCIWPNVNKGICITFFFTNSGIFEKAVSFERNLILYSNVCLKNTVKLGCMGIYPGELGVSHLLRFWAGGVMGGHGRVVKYYYILSCTGSMSKVATFEEK